jgi:hypothetical protein
MPDIQVGDLVRIAEENNLGDWKRKNNLWTVLELYRENRFAYRPATAKIHNGHKEFTLPQYLLEKV